MTTTQTPANTIYNVGHRIVTIPDLEIEFEVFEEDNGWFSIGRIIDGVHVPFLQLKSGDTHYFVEWCDAAMDCRALNGIRKLVLRRTREGW